MSRLFVYVPGLRRDDAKMRALGARLAAEPGWDNGVFLPVDSRVRWWNRRRFADAANTIAARVDAAWSGEGDIVLMGHSLGGLLVRRAYLQALGAYGPAFARPWAGSVSRIVLFAAPNRGFGKCLARHWRALLRVSRLLRPSLVDVLAGSVFVTDLRITWMRTFADLEGAGEPPYVVQLLGSEDDLVSHEDSLDVEQMRSAAHFTVPNADHRSVADVTGSHGDARWEQIRKAVFGPRTPTTPPIAQENPQGPVVLLLHGIRTGRDDWVRKAKERFRARAPEAVVRGPSYGWFSAWSFAVPFLRPGNLRFLLDFYSQELAKRPTAPFHFVGHSNGTYLLGQALAAVPAVRFERVFLAGSVLPPDYEWRARVDAGQVKVVRNDRATRDVPVGVLCNALRGVGMRDVGAAGFTGFQDDFDAMHEVAYHLGGHGAALADDDLPGIVEYVLTGEWPDPTLVPTPRKAFSFLSRLAHYWVPVVLAVVGLAAAALDKVGDLRGPVAAGSALLLAYIGLRTV